MAGSGASREEEFVLQPRTTAEAGRRRLVLRLVALEKTVRDGVGGLKDAGLVVVSASAISGAMAPEFVLVAADGGEEGVEDGIEDKDADCSVELEVSDWRARSRAVSWLRFWATMRLCRSGATGFFGGVKPVFTRPLATNLMR